MYCLSSLLCMPSLTCCAVCSLPPLQGKLVTVGSDGEGLRHLHIKVGSAAYAFAPHAHCLLNKALHCSRLPAQPAHQGAHKGASCGSTRLGSTLDGSCADGSAASRVLLLQLACIPHPTPPHSQHNAHPGLTQGWAVDGLRPGAAPAILASPARLLPSAPSKATSAAGIGAGEGSLTAVALHCEEWPAVAVALGLSNGAVHLLRADVPKSKVAAPVPAAQLRDAGSAAGSAAGGSGGGITALHFVPAPSAAAGAETGGSGAAHTGRRGETAAAPGLHLFAVGAARLAAFDARTGRRLLDDECGAAPGCSAVSCKGELMLAGPEAVYFYTGGWGAGGWLGMYGTTPCLHNS